MIFKKDVFIAAAALAAALTLSASAIADEASGKIADFTLPNGLQLVVIPDHRAPVVTPTAARP